MRLRAGSRRMSTTGAVGVGRGEGEGADGGCAAGGEVGAQGCPVVAIVGGDPEALGAVEHAAGCGAVEEVWGEEAVAASDAVAGIDPACAAVFGAGEVGGALGLAEHGLAVELINMGRARVGAW